MANLCTWCGTEHEAADGNFCSDDCSQNFSTACRIWGEEQYGNGEVSVWQLQRCLERHAHRASADSASESTKARQALAQPVVNGN